jgi:hypothetical protein
MIHKLLLYCRPPAGVLNTVNRQFQAASANLANAGTTVKMNLKNRLFLPEARNPKH